MINEEWCKSTKNINTTTMETGRGEGCVPELRRLAQIIKMMGKPVRLAIFCHCFKNVCIFAFCNNRKSIIMKKSLFVAALLMLAGMTLNAQESNYAKSDFVPGDEIIFDDNFEREKLGEFPLRWDLLDGYAETAQQKGRNVMAFTDNGLGQVMPLMKEKWDWLPEVFTVEFDLYVAPMNTGDEEGTSLEMSLYFGDRGDESYYNASSYVRFWYREDGSCNLNWSLMKPDGSNQTSGEKMLGLNSGNSDYLEKDNPVVAGEWNHFAFSFNKRAFKGYVNGVRMINVPAMKAPGYLFFASGAYYRYTGLSNVRIAQGAVPLYDRLTTDGKIVTYAITFESGKADLKPESTVEINRVAKLMQEHTDLSFEVQGHCDNTGSDAINDPLSQKRAEAIVDALVKLGIDKSRLSAVGKGSHSPIAPNTTEEGRAKNRRVEFVKK